MCDSENTQDSYNIKVVLRNYEKLCKKKDYEIMKKLCKKKKSTTKL